MIDVHIVISFIFAIIPEIMVGKSNWRNLFLNFVDFFQDDMPSVQSIESELDISHINWTKHFNPLMTTTRRNQTKETKWSFFYPNSEYPFTF